MPGHLLEAEVGHRVGGPSYTTSFCLWATPSLITAPVVPVTSQELGLAQCRSGTVAPEAVCLGLQVSPRGSEAGLDALAVAFTRGPQARGGAAPSAPWVLPVSLLLSDVCSLGIQSLLRGSPITQVPLHSLLHCSGATCPGACCALSIVRVHLAPSWWATSAP